MHKHKRHRHGYFPGGMIWWFIFAMMFFNGGDWWPWLLIPFGFYFIFGSFFQEEKRPSERKNPPSANLIPMSPPITRPDPTPMGFTHRADLLPATCTQCGGPVRSYEVKWTSEGSAVCTYCGSNLKMKK